MKSFEDGMDFLARFMDCIRWSDALELAPHFGSLATKIEASMQKIGGKFLDETNRDKWASVFTVLPFNLGGTFEKRASKWIGVLEKLNDMIHDMKPEIAEACDSLLIHSVQRLSPLHDFVKWKRFVKSTYLHLYDVEESFVANYRKPHKGKMVVLKALSFLFFVRHLAYDCLKNPKTEDFLIKVGSETIRGALLSCQWWTKNFDAKIRQDVIAARLDLKQKFWFTNPEFVDMIFILLKASEDSDTLAESFVRHLVPLRREYGPLDSLQWDFIYKIGDDLTSLVTSVLNEAEGTLEEVPVQMFLPDTKRLLMEIASFRCSLYDVRDRGVARDLLEKIWLIKMEILLRAQLAADSFLPLGRKNFDLNNAATLIKKLSEGSTRTRNANQILMLMKEVAKDLSRIEKCARKESINMEKVRNLLLKLLLKILFFKGERTFLKLHDSLGVSFKDRIESLHEGFRIMIPSVINQPTENIKAGKLEFSHLEAVASSIISLYDQILTQNVSEEVLQNMDPSLSDLANEIEFIMKETKGIYLCVERSNFPKTNAVGYIDSLLSKLRELLNYNMDLVESVITKEQIEEITGHLEFFQPFLQGISEEDIMSDELKDVGTKMINVSYEAEYLIDSIISGKEADWHNMIWLYHFLKDIRVFKIQVSKNQLKRTNKVKVHKKSRATTPKIDEGVLILVDQEKLILDQLIGELEQLHTISIVGMPGIGKTTLAKNVYNNLEVVSRFPIRAWCCVTEIYRRRKVLLEILSHVVALTGDITGMPDEDLEFKLLKILKTQRYLIVFDDVWDTDVLDDLARKFPDKGDKSRILVTTRHNHVARKANPNADPHPIRLLSVSESWKLLQTKIFHEEPYCEELAKIAEKISGSCKGLPLAVVAAAGLLENIERQHDRWNEIAESLSSRIIDDPQEQCRYILELSYEHLPDCLKACFLYFGAFLEGQDIPAQKLIQLWIAEGFLPESKSLEDLAEEYLMDLIDRSLIMLSQQKSRGGAKACRVHDVLSKLCQSKAKEDKFLQVVPGSKESSAPLHDLDYVFSSNFGNPSSCVTYADHRLCFCSKRKHFIESRPSGPHVRSLLCFATGDEDPKCPYDISFIFDNFRLLKVLDLECINMGNSFAEEIELLLQLRYLAVAGYMDCVPSSIANLWNLETFIVKGLRGKVKVNLPHTIWCLKKLRHVRVSDFAGISLQDYQHGNSSPLDCLVTVSSVILPFGEETDYILKQFPKLRKLKCIFSDSLDASKNCNHFPRLEVLDKLESLRITYYGRALHPGEFCFPSNLKKLTLSNFRLPWDKISVIGQLSKLEVLKLLSRAFVGEEWKMAEEGKFPELKYLKLDDLDLAKWNANSDHLPKLQQLVLRSCKNLEIPLDVAEMPTLEMIDVQWCGDSVEKSVRQIREEGDERLKIFINFAELQFPSANNVSLET